MKKTLLISTIVLLLLYSAINLVAQDGGAYGDDIDGQSFDNDVDLMGMLWAKDDIADESFEAKEINIGGGAGYDKAEDGNHIIKLDGGKSYLNYEDKDGNKMILNNFKGEVELNEKGEIVKIIGDVEKGSGNLATNFKLKNDQGGEYNTFVDLQEGTNVNYEDGKLTLKGDKPFSLCQKNEELTASKTFGSGKNCEEVKITPVEKQEITMNLGDDDRTIGFECEKGCHVKIEGYDFKSVDSKEGGSIAIVDAKKKIYTINEGTVFQEKCEYSVYDAKSSCESILSVSTKKGSDQPLKVSLKGECGEQISEGNFFCLDTIKKKGFFGGEFESYYENMNIHGSEDVTGDFDGSSKIGTVVNFYDLPGFESESIIEANGKRFTMTEEYTLLDDEKLLERLNAEGSVIIINPNYDKLGKVDITEIKPDGETEYSVACDTRVPLMLTGGATVGATSPTPSQQTSTPDPKSDCGKTMVVDKTFSDAQIRQFIKDQGKFKIMLFKNMPSDVREKVLRSKATQLNDETIKRALEIFEKEYASTK